MTATPVDEHDSDGGLATPLESLTDEELAILGRPDSIVVAPFLDRIGEDQLDTAKRTAYRGLLARGILDPPTAQALTAAEGLRPAGDERRTREGVELSVRPDVHAIVTMRAAARGVIAVARSTSRGRDFWYAHVVDDACLVEQVSSDGIHRFALLGAAKLPEALVDAVVHPDTGDGTGEPVEFTPSADEPAPLSILERLGQAHVHCEVVIRTVGDSGAVMLGAFTGPAGAWMFRSTYAADRPLSVEPCTAAQVRGRLRATTVDALARLGAAAATPPATSHTPGASTDGRPSTREASSDG